MLLQFFASVAAGPYRKGPRADRLAALDVVRRIADDQDFVTLQIAIQAVAGALASDGSDLATIFVVIAETAGAEVVPQVVVSQFDLRAEAYIARQQAEERWLREGARFTKPRTHTRQNMSADLMKEIVEPEYVGIKELLKILGRVGDAMPREHLPHNRRIGPTGKPQVLRPVCEIEDRAGNFAKRPFAGATGVDEGAVDIEQNEADHDEAGQAGSVQKLISTFS